MNFEKKMRSDGFGIFATKNIKCGEIIYDFSASKTVFHQTQYNSQISENVHIEYPCDDFKYDNHDCNPNFYNDYVGLKAYALRDIESGEELTRNYCTNHWILKCPFQCTCNFNNCYGYIQGAKYLNKTQIKTIYYQLTPFIKQKLKQRNERICKSKL
eukprot:136703_1